MVFSTHQQLIDEEGEAEAFVPFSPQVHRWNNYLCFHPIVRTLLLASKVAASPPGSSKRCA